MDQLVTDLIKYFLDEGDHPVIDIPKNYINKRDFLRGLINVREAKPIPDSIISKENELLKLELDNKKVIDINDFSDKFTLWQGDITCIKCDAVVTPASPNLLGCFTPNHNCVDNKIHTYAGISLRLKCREITRGSTIETSKVTLTKGYNLPCTSIIHTVKPEITTMDEETIEYIKDFYYNSFELSKKNNIKTIVIPNLFSKDPLLKKEIAKVTTSFIKNYIKEDTYFDKIVFNVFTLDYYNMYQELFNEN